MESEETVVEWLPLFSEPAGVGAAVVGCGVTLGDCSVVEDEICRDEKLIKVVCEESYPMIVCAFPLCTEKVPLPLPQLQVPPRAAGPQHHLLSPQDTSPPLLSETGSSI